MNGLFQNITHALGWSMIHSLWQGVLLYSILCLLYVAFPKLRSKDKYTLAFIAQLCVFVAFILTFSHYIDVTKLSARSASAIAPFSELAYNNTPSSIFTSLESLFPWFASLYVLGLFMQLILFSNSLSKLHYLKTKGLQDAPSIWQDCFQRTLDKLQLRKDIRFFLSEKVSVPLTLGHVKPIILFPIALVNNLDLKQVESILMHELAHIKRHDYLLNLLKVVMETILFFNPFTWLLSKHIDAEREHACDDMVIEQLPSPIAYAQALMSVEINRNNTAPAYAMAATGKNYHLLHRIQRITKMEKKYINVKQHLLAVALSSLTLITVAWIAPADKETSTKKEVPHEAQAFLHEVADTSSIEQLFLSDAITPTVQDTCQSKKTSTVVYSSNDSIPNVIVPPLPPEMDAKIAELSKKAAEIQVQFNSPQWKAHIAEVEASAKNIEEYYNSAEWKEHIAKIEENARSIEAYYDSPKWKNYIAKVEENAKKVEEYYNSEEWKNHIAKIEENAKKIEDYYNSPEWKEKVAKIEENAKKITEYYESSEWKEKVKKQMQESKSKKEQN